MKQGLVIFFIFYLLIIPVSAEIDEKALSKNFGDFLKEKFMKITRLDVEVQETVNEIDPKITKTAKKVCEETVGIRFIVAILTLLSIFGAITLNPATIVIAGMDIWVIFTYTCWFF